MKKMTLGEFRKLTEHMSDDAVICMSIDRNGEWIHPSAKYIVTYADVEDIGMPAEVVLGHKVKDLED